MATDASGTGGGQSSVPLCGQRTVVDRGETSPHQLFGDAGSTERSVDVSAPREGQIRVRTDDNTTTVSNVSGEGRGDQVASAITSSLPHSPLVSETTDQADAGLREGNGEHGGGRPVTQEGDRVVHVSQDGTKDLQAVRDTGHRPVRLQLDGPTEQVYVPGQLGSPRSGCSGPAVDIPIPLRVPTPDPGSDGGEQTEGVHIQDATKARS